MSTQNYRLNKKNAFSCNYLVANMIIFVTIIILTNDNYRNEFPKNVQVLFLRSHLRSSFFGNARVYNVIR